MARKKQEVQLQVEIGTQEEWEEILQKEGLLVVDVYQDWCGPCKAVTGFFRRMKNEIGDDFLNFATAKADCVDSLEKYRGKCEPCFLIYGSGSLVAVIRGANPPALEETIKTKLDYEHKVMKGEMERQEIRDPMFADIELEEKPVESDKDVEEVEREVTLALIKPDVVKSGKANEIITKLKESGIDILAQEERNLTEEEAESFYHNMRDTTYFKDLIKLLTSGPSFVLVLAKGDEGIIGEFRELIGPKNLDEAKEKAPQSLRAIYGTNSIENAIHAADNKENVNRELAFFFPDFVIPKISRKKHEESHVQQTLALIRPAAYLEFKDSILEKIRSSGFQIAMQKEVQLTKEDAALFYKHLKDKPFFDELTTEMSKGTLLVLALEKQNAVGNWRSMLGPKDPEKAKETDPNSLRAQFSKDDIKINLIHGSDSDDNAELELKFFFPVEQTIMVVKPDGMENYDEIINKIKDARFQVVKTKQITMKKEIAKEFYSDRQSESYYDDLIDHMQSGPSMVVVLSRKDAVRGLRSIIGPKDPVVAAEHYPDSIRSIYGKDIKANAVYGCDNVSEVDRVIKLIFNKLEFAEDGSLLPQYMDTTEEETTDIGETETVEEQKEPEKTDEQQEQTTNEAEVAEQSEDQGESNEQVTVTEEGKETSEKEEVEEKEITTTEETEKVETDQVEAEQAEAEHAEAEHTETEHTETEHAETEEASEKVTEEEKEPETVATEPTETKEATESAAVEDTETNQETSHVEKTETDGDHTVNEEATGTVRTDDEEENPKTQNMTETFDGTNENDRTEVDGETQNTKPQEDETVVENTETKTHESETEHVEHHEESEQNATVTENTNE